MTASLHCQNELQLPAPGQSCLQRWVDQALLQAGYDKEAELTLRIVDEPEIIALNKHYRGRSSATNVLAFPAGLPAHLELPLLGDIIACAPVIEREARHQDKPAEAHWAHMLVHGTLHLLGHDHQSASEAALMESLETRILTALSFAPPYEPTDPIT